MNIVRQSLVPPGKPEILGTYTDITLHTGNKFVEQAAEQEADRIGATTEADVVPDETNPNQRVRLVRLIKDGVTVAQYTGVWPAEDEEDTVLWEDEPKP